MDATAEPKTLQEAIGYLSDPVNCRNYLVIRGWADGVTCPPCGSKNVLFLEKYTAGTPGKSTMLLSSQSRPAS